MNSNTLNKIIIGLVCVIGIVIIILLSKGCSKTVDTAEIKLIGNENITVRQYENYLEYGYKIINQKESGYSVKIDKNVNTNVVGVYEVTYNLYNNKGELISTVKRKVYVTNDDLSTTKIVLKGDPIEYYFVGDYVDNGFVAYRNSTNVADFVKINSNVNNDEPGKYTVEYYIINGNNKKNVTREVYIVDLDIAKNISKGEHIIKLSINTLGYDHVVLPNEKTNKSNNITYKYSVSNLKDEYVFDVYLKSGSHKKYVINSNELGADKLSGKCSLSYGNKTTTVTITMNDLSLVKKFRTGSEDFTTTTKVFSGYKNKVTVRAYNYANQGTDIVCTGTPPTPTPKPVRTPKPGGNGGSGNSSSGGKPLDTGIKTKNYSKIGDFPCKYDVTADNIELDNKIKEYGYKTRGAVMAAGLFLGNYKYNIPYYWAGKYFEKGLNPNWGCGGLGLDCTGFTKWCFIQAGFDSNIIPRSGMGTSMWGSVNASNYLFKFSSENLSVASNIQPGDIVTTPGVHAGVVIGVNGNSVQVAQESKGTNIIQISKTDGRTIDDGSPGFSHFVLLEEFYKLYGQ